MMKVLFLAVEDLEKGKYVRQGKKNLLKTEIGAGDTIALCGRVTRTEKTNYGPRLWIDDGQELGVVVGTFNQEVRKDAREILETFRKGQELYLLVYGNPYYRGRLYINVNQNNGVVIVGKEVYQKFHQMRKRSKDYLTEAKDSGKGSEKEDITYQDIFKFLKERGGKSTIEEIEAHFSKVSDERVDEKILELLESGGAYEPQPELITLLD